MSTASFHSPGKHPVSYRGASGLVSDDKVVQGRSRLPPDTSLDLFKASPTTLALLRRLGADTVGDLMAVTMSRFYAEGGSVVRDLDAIRRLMAPWLERRTDRVIEPLITDVFNHRFEKFPLSEIYLPEKIAQHLAPCDWIQDLRKHPVSTLDSSYGLPVNAVEELRKCVRGAFVNFTSGRRHATVHRPYDAATTPFLKHVAEEVHLFSPRISAALSTWLELEGAPLGIEGLCAELGLHRPDALLLKGTAIAKLDAMTGVFARLRVVIDPIAAAAPVPAGLVGDMVWAKGLPDAAFRYVLKRVAGLNVVQSQFSGKYVVPHTFQAWEMVESGLLQILREEGSNTSPSKVVERLGAAGVVSLNKVSMEAYVSNVIAYRAHKSPSKPKAKTLQQPVLDRMSAAKQAYDARVEAKRAEERDIERRVQEVLETRDRVRSESARVERTRKAREPVKIDGGVRARSKKKTASLRRGVSLERAERRQKELNAQQHARDMRKIAAENRARDVLLAREINKKARLERRSLRQQLEWSREEERRLRKELERAERRAEIYKRNDSRPILGLAHSVMMPVPVGLFNPSEFSRKKVRSAAASKAVRQIRLSLLAPASFTMSESERETVREAVERTFVTLGLEVIDSTSGGNRLDFNIKMGLNVNKLFVQKAVRGTADLLMFDRYPDMPARGPGGKFWRTSTVVVQ